MHDGSCFLCTNTCFFHVSPTPEIYTLSLHDALPISLKPGAYGFGFVGGKFILMDLAANNLIEAAGQRDAEMRSEEHTSELQSHSELVCRLLLEKKKRLLRFRFGCAEVCPHSTYQLLQ